MPTIIKDTEDIVIILFCVSTLISVLIPLARVKDKNINQSAVAIKKYKDMDSSSLSVNSSITPPNKAAKKTKAFTFKTLTVTPPTKLLKAEIGVRLVGFSLEISVLLLTRPINPIYTR
jgi:hypothetical protein